MRNISLITIPGDGRSVRTIQPGTTLASFVATAGVSDRMITLNGVTVPASEQSGIDLYSYDGRVEVCAVQGSKGN
jgi:hypothetical protein